MSSKYSCAVGLIAAVSLARKPTLSVRCTMRQCCLWLCLIQPRPRLDDPRFHSHPLLSLYTSIEYFQSYRAMSFGGFGLSLGDFALLAQHARNAFQNCQQPDDEYAEIALEVRCLHSVLRTVRALAERPDSPIKRQERTTRAQLTSCANGCKNVLNDLDYVLAKYTTLNGGGKPSVGKMV